MDSVVDSSVQIAVEEQDSIGGEAEKRGIEAVQDNNVVLVIDIENSEGEAKEGNGKEKDGKDGKAPDIISLTENSSESGQSASVSKAGSKEASASVTDNDVKTEQKEVTVSDTKEK